MGVCEHLSAPLQYDLMRRDAMTLVRRPVETQTLDIVVRSYTI
jgi:hypothetical protein